MCRPSDATLRSEGFAPYVKSAIVWARRMNDSFVIPSSKGDLTAKAGDYMLTDGKSRTWPVDASIFSDTHTFVSDSSRPDLEKEGYTAAQKTAPTWARQLSAPMRVETLEGPREANSGDWLAVGAAGERWPIPDDFFSTNYIPA